MKTSMAAGVAALCMLTSTLSAARDVAPVVVVHGAQIGVVNLLGPQLMHYHGARSLKDSFVKVQAVDWSVDDMLNDALDAQLAQLGLTPVPLAVTDSLARSREDCFVNARLVKGLPKECSEPLTKLAASAGVDFLIVMAPGLNNSDHTGGTRHDGLSETLRGWGFLTHEQDGLRDKPTVFNETELLLIGITPGGATLRARQWGGDYLRQWQTYAAPTDLKEMTATELNDLQPLFAGVLSQQTRDLLGHVRVESGSSALAQVKEPH
jgi:hypothetical protein